MTNTIYHQVDREQLAKDLDDVRKEVLSDLGEADFQHLKKIERWGRFCTVLGYATAWIIPNPISVYFISQGSVTRWTTIAHHILHRGYDKIEGLPNHYTSKGFAKGKRRYIDWFEWMLPEAWDKEHNELHHYNLGEQTDPDQVEFNTKYFRAINMPLWLRYFLLGLMACIWKFFYYAPVTLRHLRNSKAKKAGKNIPPLSKLDEWNPLKAEGQQLWLKCLLPYASIRFVLMPLLFIPVGIIMTVGGTVAATNVLINSLLAEVISNIHTFLVIGTNHVGEDLYVFEEKSTNKGEYYLRQILGSTNFTTGTDPVDFVHGWLNYQIEHHLWPDIPLSRYQIAQPKVKAVCEKHGIPYCQEPVFTRLWKTLDIMTGKKVMLRPPMVSE
ncbi:MAG: fatty acid desaturase [Methylococcales symbiont of Hymedesmia sp. n. MRB-2018]|nr:MAG: fatty acid desaturase [Methylococcales symbiont of Hymedesmia sp. n. MRB-2018]